MLGLIIAVVLAKKGHQIGAWVVYALCLALSVMSTLGTVKHNMLVYGQSGVSGVGVLIFIVVYLVAFILIATADGSAVAKKKYVTFGLVTAEKIYENYTTKDHFGYMGVDNPYPLVNKLNEISESLDGVLKNASENTGMNLVEHYAFLYERLQKNGKDVEDAANTLGITYNNCLDEAYVKGLSSYVAKHMD